MQSFARVTLSAFGVLAAAAGLEHGIGEITQGNIQPEGVMILSWPDAPFFQIHSGEPAMTLIPNLLVSGILTVLVSLVFLAWVVFFIDRKRAGLVTILLSLLLLVVGGGVGPPVLGIILGIAATRMRAPDGRKSRPSRRQPLPARLWVWFFSAGLAAWLLLFPGLNLIDYAMRGNLSDGAVYGVILSAFSLLLLAIWSGLAADRARQE